MVGFVFSIIVEDSYGLIIPLSTEELYDQSQVIFVGNITSVNVLEFEKSSVSYIEKDGIETEEIEHYILSLDEYVVNVEEFVKNPQDSSIITVRQPTTSVPGRIVPVGGFELGDRVLFYIQNFDGENEYSFSSFKIPKQCDTKKVSEQPRIRFRDSFDIFQDGVAKDDNFSEGIPMGFVLSKDLDTLYGGSIDVFVSIRKDGDSQVLFEKDIHSALEECNWVVSAKWKFTPEEGKYRMYLRVTENEKSGVGESYTHFTVVPQSPLKQFNVGISVDEIKCKENLVLLQKYNGSPACVKPVTKQHLIDRGWAKIAELSEITDDPEALKLNVVRVEDSYISLYPENTCASIHLDLLSDNDIKRYKNDQKGLDVTNVLQIDSDDLKEIPIIQELVYAVHSIDFPYNKHSSVYLDGLALVQYEFFLMDKAIQNYGDSQEDYFIKLDSDYEERFSNPAKQGFSNTFEAPIILYNNDAYSVSGTVFWTSDEHEPMRLTISPKNVIEDDEKFIILTDDDFESVPKIKEAIEGIGTIKESITASKGLPEDEWNQYREWLSQQSQDQLGTDSFRLIEYDDELYSIGFAIC